MEVSRGSSSSLTKIYKATRVGGSDSDDRLEEVIQLYGEEEGEGDSSSVDSDDSLEQEIRTFGALKAQSRRDTCPQSSHSPLALPGPNRQACGPKAPVSKTLDLSLSCKGQCRGGGNTLWPSIPKKTREVAKEGASDAALGQRKAQPAKEKPVRRLEGRAGQEVASPLQDCRAG
ncbi:Protein KIAA0649 [Myotis davidii]|uniref:Protein KIAA0649 n=1 Tax=Myotis davidii TaxID=225400 RepID=L5LT55_MYODS|nr:Protein KIAA0649 [Myotis davidii]